MIRCKQSKNTKSIPSTFVLRAVGLVLMLTALASGVCGCAGEDKYVEIIIASDDVVVTPVPKPHEADSSRVSSLYGPTPAPVETEGPSKEN